MSINDSRVMGYLGADPEVHTFEDGSKVSNFSVATTFSWKDRKTGEAREQTDWHRIVARGNLATIVERFLKKGSHVHVSGKLRTRQYKDNKNDATAYVTEIIAGKIEMINSPDFKDNDNNTKNANPEYAHGADTKPNANNEDDKSLDDNENKVFTGEISQDIPF